MVEKHATRSSFGVIMQNDINTSIFLNQNPAYFQISHTNQIMARQSNTNQHKITVINLNKKIQTLSNVLSSFYTCSKLNMKCKMSLPSLQVQGNVQTFHFGILSFLTCFVLPRSLLFLFFSSAFSTDLYFFLFCVWLLGFVI